MLTRMLTAVVLAPISQVPAPPCTLAGPPVEARWSRAIPRASTAEAPLRVVANLDGFPTVTGVLAVPVEHRAYAAATGDHAVVVVDDSTFRIVARVPGPRFPDGIAYAPEQRRVFVSDESGRRDFVIDATTNTVVAQVELGGEAGNTQYDAGSHCVIVAVQTANQLAVIDPATATIVRRITFDKAVRYPHGFYIDAPHRLTFVSGQESGTLGVLD